MNAFFSSVSRALVLAVLLPVLLTAQNPAAVPVPRGGTTIPLPSNTPTIKVKNMTGETAFDVRFEVLDGDTAKITAADVVAGPGMLEDNDKVDDNDDGRIDAGTGSEENNQADSSPGKSCRSIFGKAGDTQTEVKNGEEITINLVLDADPPPGARIQVLFSTVGPDPLNPGMKRHFDLCAAVPLGPPGATLSQDMPAGTHLANLLLTNTTPDFIVAVLIEHPLPFEQMTLEPPYHASLTEPAGTAGTIVHFSPPLAPFDYVDVNVAYAVPFAAGFPPQTYVTLETVPYQCDLAMHNFQPGPCNAFGQYDLTFDIKYQPVGAGFWKEYTVTNSTTKTMSDLHVTFRGTGGSLTTTVVDNPDGCPQPTVPSDDVITNTMELRWGSNCVAPGSSVKVKVCTANGPLEPDGGYWTVDNGVKDADIAAGDVVAGPAGGQPGQAIAFFINGEYAGAYTPLGLGNETVTLPGLPANGAGTATVTAVWTNGFPCSAETPDAFNEPDCANTGFFALDAVRQVSYRNPVAASQTDLGELTFRYYNPPGSTDKYLNIVQRSATDPTTGVWIADNIDLEAFGDTSTYHFLFDLDPAGVRAADLIDRVELAVFVTDDILPQMPVTPAFVTYPVGEVVFDFGNNATQLTELGGIFPEPLPSQPQRVWETDSTRTVLRGCAMPNIDLIDSLHYGNPNVPSDYANDFNACGPVATANSFSWLRAQHAVLDSLLDRDSLLNNNTSDSTARRQMVYEFSRLMDRNPDSPTRLDSFIMGKLAFIDKYRLPVHVKYQSVIWNGDIASPDPAHGHKADNENAPTDTTRPNAKVSLEWLMQEMKRGEDVELLVHWVTYDSLGNPVFTGHYVTLTGLRYNHGNWRLRFKDDPEQIRPGGLRHGITGARPTNDSVPTVGRGLIELENLADSTLGRCFITHAVSESFDSTVMFVGTRDPADRAPLACRIVGNPVVAPGPPPVLELTLPQAAEVHIALFDARGERRWARAAGRWAAGTHRFDVAAAASLPAGMYWVQVRAGGRQGGARLVVVR